ncbi:hypothetical protein [Cyclonatronum proteinivorum]|nr:hypothetical protein [Cyclonatronum proteinivorum]
MQVSSQTPMPAVAPSAGFSFERIGQLLYWHFTEQKRLWLYAALLVAGLVAVFVLVFFLFSDDLRIVVNQATAATEGQSLGVTLSFYMIAGLYFSSRIFRNLHNPDSGWQYLMLPASKSEKFAAAWLFTGPLYTIAAFSYLWILKTILMLIVSLTTSETMSIPALVSGTEVSLLKSYFFWQTFFLWGSVYFRSQHFLKSANTAVAAGLTLFGIVISGWMLSGNSFIGFFTFMGDFRESTRLVLIWQLIQLSIAALMLWLGYTALKKSGLRP